jgi:sodium/potassium-transporting ATPase subunit alpha
VNAIDLAQADWHKLSADDIFRRLASSLSGLSESEAAARLRHEGANLLTESASPSWIKRFGKHLRARFALLLWAGAALAFVAERFDPGKGMALISGALVVVVLLNATFSFWQETRVEQAMAAFREMLAPRARVLRDGDEKEIDAAEVVIGDVIILREGDRIPADGRLFEVRTLKVDNSALTGESQPQLRTAEPVQGSHRESRNLVFSGTTVSSGRGKAIVVAIGNGTEIGRIAKVTHETIRVETPIRREIAHFIKLITRIALAIGLIFFAAGWALGNPLWANLVFAIGILVANVPEGLLPTVTLGLAISGRKMAKRHALLKTLESAETLGCATVICTDKTGTLTRDEMRVTDVLPAVEERERLRSVMALCNNAEIIQGEGGFRGDPTETALLHWLESEYPGEATKLREAHSRVFERPFDSETREMAVVHHFGNEHLSLLKGAPEVVLSQCDLSIHEPDSSGPVTRSKWNELADELARGGKRVLAMAEKRVAVDEDLESHIAGNGYRLLGLVAMHDPPRPEVAAAVTRCREAGIRIIVVSGDHPLTVEAISREVGILTGPAEMHLGNDIPHLGNAAMRALVAREGVHFARTKPLDKLRIVAALQQNGEVVAVTGDGVNDAPALKRADIGIAMGKTGTDVAREAADMVLMDDNFSTIVAAVEEGRVLYANIRRFIGYVLTSNVPEILPYIAFVLFNLPLPLTVLLILAIDLGTDMVPAIGLATESAETDMMKFPPRPRTQRLLSKRLLLESYLVGGMIEAMAGFAAYFTVLFQGGWRFGVKLPDGDPLAGQSVSAFFTAVILCQVANVFVWRTTRHSVFTKGLARNRAVVAGIAIELVALLWIVNTPSGHAWFGTATPPPSAWFVALPFMIAMLALAELRKWLSRRGA